VAELRDSSQVLLDHAQAVERVVSRFILVRGHDHLLIAKRPPSIGAAW
jgi:hypothetical protein